MKAIDGRALHVWSIAVAMALLTGVLHAALPATNRLELVDGTVFTNVKFKRADAQTVTFTHAAGISRVPILELPDDARALFNLTNVVATPPPAAPQPAAGQPTVTSPPPVRAVGDYQTCPRCQGAGVTVCPTCHGRQFAPDKIVETRCGACSGSGHTWVPVYSSYGGGAGRRVERWQTGNVRRTCSECDGKGKLETRERTYCPVCQGHGTATCSACGGSRVVKRP